ncbi:MAG: LamG domain-containing protein [Patescibacteria group bacterium]
MNGVLKATYTSNTYGFRINSTLRMGMGSWCTTASDCIYPGILDEVKLYNSALTAAQVKLDYNRGQSLVLGTLSDNSSYEKQAANQEYCVPGDTTSCAAPVARWDFEEGSGTAANDKSGNANTGTLTAGPTWTRGKYGKAVNFDGTDDYVSVADSSSLDATGAITLSAWVKTSGTNDYSGIIHKFSSTLNGYEMSFHTSGGVRADFGNGTTYISPSSSTNVEDGNWHLVTATYDGTTAKIFVDGILGANTATGTGYVTTNNDALLLGNDNDVASRFFNGAIDEVRIYNYARSQAQIAWDYNQGKPVGHWKFDECQGPTAGDSSGRGNSGTITIGASGTQTSVGTCSTSGTARYNGVSGKYNYSVNFDGTDDYVTLSDSAALKPTTALTVSAWVKPTNFTCAGADTNCTIFTKYGGNFQGYRFFTNSSGIVGMRICTPSTCPGTDSAQALATGTWSHVVGVWDGASVRIYINGRQSGSTGTATAITQDTTAPTIGKASWYNGDYFNGQIDDVKVFNYALTAGQVKTLYNQAGAVRYGPLTGAP